MAQEKNFSRAAERLHITQSALSQRLQKLESELEITLVIRAAGGAELTEAGVRLLQYCQIRESLEQEFLSDLFGSDKHELGGVIRIAGYSSVMRSVIQPTLAPLLKKNPALQIELVVKQLKELPGLLLGGEADFIILDHVFDRSSVESYVLGQESYVLVESNKLGARGDVFLDQSPDDIYSQSFLRRQGERLANVKKSFVNDIYGILDGVQAGLGKGIVPKHLIKGRSGLRVSSSLNEQHVPVVLHFFHQPYYSRMMQSVIDLLNEKASLHLAT